MRMHLDLRNGTGIEEIIFNSSVNVYPNPASEHINILWNNADSKLINVDLINLGGSVVKSFSSRSTESIQLDIPAVSTGLYWLRIIRNDLTLYRKLIIEN